MSIRDHERYSIYSLEADAEQDPKGKLFYCGSGWTDLTNVKIIHSGVDTIRQLYRGTMKKDLFEFFEEKKTQHDAIITLMDEKWSFGCMGKNSGFRYRIQNNDLGIIILVGSYYAEANKDGAHLKIELSPQFILGQETSKIQEYLDHIAFWLYGYGFKASGVAVHLACDVQEWTPNKDFRINFRTHSRAIQDYNGISEAQYNVSGISVEYGKNQGYLFGKSTALQMALYRKDDEMIKTDKVDFWHDRYNNFTNNTWDKDQPIWRIEARIHHNIIREIGIAQRKTFEKFSQVVEYLKDIWQYSLSSNRLKQSVKFIDPFWQLIRDDAEFYNPAKGIIVKRKKKDDVEGVGRNYGQIIGNIITVGARESWTLREVMLQLKRMFFYDDILSYYRSRGLSENKLRQRIDKALILRRLKGKAA